jgi:RNA polymerase sigma-70 factor (sigma-E family)
MSEDAVRSDDTDTLPIDEVYRQQADYFGRVAFLLTGDAEQAQDLVHEAFARVLGRRRHVRDALALRGYLRRTIVNLAIKGYRKRDNERAYLRRWGHTDQRLASLPDVETRQQLIDALKVLPGRQRAVVVLRYYEDLPERDIAAVLGCPIGTVKSSLSRALVAMKVELEGDHDE